MRDELVSLNIGYTGSGVWLAQRTCVQDTLLAALLLICIEWLKSGIHPWSGFLDTEAL